MKEKSQNREAILKELHSDPLWKSIGLLDADEDLSEKNGWGVVKWESG